MPSVERYRKLPVEIEVILWDGTLSEDVQAFIGGKIVDQPPPEMGKHLFWNDELRVWDTEGHRHLLIPKGHHIARGVRDELYPISPDVLAETFTPVEPR